MTRPSFRTVAFIVALAAVPRFAVAQQPLELSIRDGQVTLHARNVSVRTILGEWARIGGTTVVNGDRVGGGPVTLDLVNVPERQALDVVLRSVSGYVLAARPTGSTGVSAYDRILILASSAAPRTAPTTSVANGTPGRVPQPIATPDPNDADENSSADLAADGAPGGPRPGTRRPALPRQPGAPQPASTAAVAGQPQTQPDPPDDDQPADGNDGTGNTTATTPGNPFGVPAGSSATPGVVTPVPQPQQTPQRRNQERD